MRTDADADADAGADAGAAATAAAVTAAKWQRTAADPARTAAVAAK
jgi:hypothetical protein